MAADDMGVAERAWLCAGWRVVNSTRVRESRTLVPDGMLPVALVPAGHDAKQREAALALAMVDVVVERRGWLYLVRELARFDAETAVPAACSDDVAD